MAEERPLPTSEAIRDRRARVEEELKEKRLDLRLTSRWRPWRRIELNVDIAYLEGLAEGLRLGGAGGSRPDPSQ